MTEKLIDKVAEELEKARRDYFENLVNKHKAVEREPGDFTQAEFEERVKLTKNSAYDILVKEVEEGRLEKIKTVFNGKVTILYRPIVTT